MARFRSAWWMTGCSVRTVRGRASDYTGGRGVRQLPAPPVRNPVGSDLGFARILPGIAIGSSAGSMLIDVRSAL